MNKMSGATAICPGSHKFVKEINAYREAHRGELHGAPDEFRSVGLTPGVLNGKAGDLHLFDTATYHDGCDAEDPTGGSGRGPNELLRAVCILSMAPTRLLAPHRAANSGGARGFNRTPWRPLLDPGHSGLTKTH
jgi:hypothetical protein